MAPHLTRRQQKAVDAQKQAQIELGANRQQADLLRQVDGKRPFCYGDYSFFKDHQVQFLDFPTLVRDTIYDHCLILQLSSLASTLLARLDVVPFQINKEERRFLASLKICRTLIISLRQPDITHLDLDEYEKQQIRECFHAMICIHPGSTKLTSRLNVCLLGVNKQLYNEASRHLFSKNIFAVEVCPEHIPMTMLLILKPKQTQMIRHVEFRILNDKQLADASLKHDTFHVRSHLKKLIEIMCAHDMKLRSLSIRYLTVYGGAVEEARGVIDATATHSTFKSNITGTIMADVYGNAMIMDKERAIQMNIFRSQICLAPLKNFTGRVDELSIQGDMTQLYMDQIIDAIAPSRVTERIARKKAARARELGEEPSSKPKSGPETPKDVADMMADRIVKEHPEFAAFGGRKFWSSVHMLMQWSHLNNVSPARAVELGLVEMPEMEPTNPYNAGLESTRQHMMDALMANPDLWTWTQMF